ncbi:hypothetical protein I302_103870 [Kwoniella bestiolae CBS 10118]|uniref:DUF1080 domain-containing protein n=1 Tax=Kwoniella bestiolae CBS 10118 TaxID=1296100 RepID=A0A1B9G9S6_9TREE|nr:hypothetical protein I302_02575 [Kwoniella bestiolae CBS 10118]OCF27730.1 hypothetical protein I302_02575 [Kwoniella bestiolae CBS 10118]
MTTISFNDTRWKPLGKVTHKPTISKDGNEIRFPTEAGTDWWRTPEVDSQNGLVYGYDQAIGKEGLEISVDVDVRPEIQVGFLCPWGGLSDQAALFLKLDDITWIKAGLEFDNGKIWAGVVITSPYSDWSLQSPPPDQSRFTFALKGQKLKVYLNDEMIREVNVFGDGKAQKGFVGVMGCSPKGGGAEVTFRDFTVREGVRD